MRHATVAATAAALLLISAGPAAAGGSDGEPPYTVTPEGLSLPAGATFHPGSHVNVKFTLPGEDAVHENNVHVETTGSRGWAELDGESFVPWDAFGAVPAKRVDVNLNDLDAFCITWVQVEGYDEHFGEGGQAPVCTTDATAPAPSSTAPAPKKPVTAGTAAPVPEPEDGTPQDRAPQDTETQASTDDVPAAVQDAPDAPAADDEQVAERTPASPVAGTTADTEEAAVVAAPVEQQAAAAPAPSVVPEAASADELPRTGAAVAGLVVAATALLGAGAALLLARRRRQV